jgi:RNA polymerase sigma-70 factor (ECF subfamily)
MQPATFHSMYEAHARDVFRYARFLTGSDDAAADIASETFLRAWAGREAIRLATAKAFLLAIARNLCRDRGRRLKRWPGAAMPEIAVPADADARLELDRTLRAIDGLPLEYREPLLLAASGVGYEEIGRILGLAVGTVKIRVHRARLKLVAATEGSAGGPR